MKKLVVLRTAALLLVLAYLLCGAVLAAPAQGPVEQGCAKSLLLMEAESGKVLWEENARARLEPASVTKVMTLLLAMEALESGRLQLSDSFTVSAAAAGMGGSQVYMEAGEKFSLDELLKCIAVVSANDACVVPAEGLCGSEAAFVERMNARAAELGMEDTEFQNCTGLPAAGHLTSARDIALMSRELLKYEKILSYTNIWMDSIRGGDFGLANTNKLLKSYPGITGLKTGSTDAAGFCISATAEREDMALIAVVLGCKTSADRFDAAAKLLDYGFANYTCPDLSCTIPEVRVDMGTQRTLKLIPAQELRPVVLRDRAGSVTLRAEAAEETKAPVRRGDVLGELIWQEGEEILARTSLVAEADVARIGFAEILARLMGCLFAVEKYV